MTARHLIEMLKVRHDRDVLLPEIECGKTGIRMDAWVLDTGRGSKATGYEVKVSRSDFLNDNKWPNYLPYCNDFYFVAPNGIIMLEEIPEQCGFLEASTNGTRLYTRKKAPLMSHVVPQSMFVRAIMRLTNKRLTAREWELWMKEKSRSTSIGHQAAARIRGMAHKQVHEIRLENERLKMTEANVSSQFNAMVRAGILTVDGGLTEEFQNAGRGSFLSINRLQNLKYQFETCMKEINGAIDAANVK